MSSLKTKLVFLLVEDKIAHNKLIFGNYLNKILIRVRFKVPKEVL